MCCVYTEKLTIYIFLHAEFIIFFNIYEKPYHTQINILTWRTNNQVLPLTTAACTYLINPNVHVCAETLYRTGGTGVLFVPFQGVLGISCPCPWVLGYLVYLTNLDVQECTEQGLIFIPVHEVLGISWYTLMCRGVQNEEYSLPLSKVRYIDNSFDTISMLSSVSNR